MAIEFKTEQEREVWGVVNAINEAWVNDRAPQVALHLHPDCVMASPDFSQYLRGKDAVVNSYVEYTKMARTLAFGLSNASVDIFGDIAMVNATFVMTYELRGKVYQGQGRDIWTLKHTNDRWYGIWRSLADVYEEEMK